MTQPCDFGCDIGTMFAWLIILAAMFAALLLMALPGAIILGYHRIWWRNVCEKVLALRQRVRGSAG